MCAFHAYAESWTLLMNTIALAFGALVIVYLFHDMNYHGLRVVSLKLTVFYLHQIISAVHYCHHKNIVHRDLKVTFSIVWKYVCCLADAFTSMSGNMCAV